MTMTKKDRRIAPKRSVFVAMTDIFFDIFRFFLIFPSLPFFQRSEASRFAIGD